MKEDIAKFHDTYRFHYFIKKKDIPIQLFIDSRDVLHMILGIKSLTINGTFDQDGIVDEGTLIRGLIFNGWMNSFRVLLPHEDEVLYNITRYKSTIDNVNEFEKGELLYFLEQIIGIKLDDLIKKEPIQIFRKIKKEKNAVKLYVSKYLLNILNWNDRLKYLYNNIYKSDEQNYNYEECFNSELFNILISKGFSILRPRNKDSNVVDALVLCSIKKKLEKHIKNPNDKEFCLPVFYDSSGFFRNILHLTELEDSFLYSYDDKNKISIIQGSDFFLLQALSKQIESRPLISKADKIDYQKYVNLSNKISIDINELNIIDKLHLSEIKEFVDTKFIKVFWINQDQESIEFISNLKKQLNSKTVRVRLDEDLSNIILDLKKRVSNYSVFREIFSALLHAHKTIKERFTDNIAHYYEGDNHLDLFRDYGLTRFSIYSKDCDELQDVVDDIFSQNEQKGALLSAHLSKIVTYLTNGYMDPSKINQEKLIVGISILWILEKHGLILDILEKLNYDYSYYCLGFFHAASLVKYKDGNINTDEICRIMDVINTSRGAKYSFSRNYKTSLAASYIYYHLWEKRTISTFRSSLTIKAERSNELNEDTYLTKAIELATTSICYLREGSKYAEVQHRKNKYYYLINNLIYYITMGGTFKEFDDILEYANELQNLKTIYPSFWQYRFDDTLSLYYLRLALANVSRNKLALQHLKTAKEYNLKAVQKALTIEDENIISLTGQKIDETIAKLKDT